MFSNFPYGEDRPGYIAFIVDRATAEYLVGRDFHRQERRHGIHVRDHPDIGFSLPGYYVESVFRDILALDLKPSSLDSMNSAASGRFIARDRIYAQEIDQCFL